MDGGISLPPTDDQPLYASRVKIHPKDVHGRFRRLKWVILAFCMSVYYVLPWLRWDRGPGVPDQAFLLDLSTPRGYILWLEIWPQEVYFLTGLLILGAFSIFFVSALVGRLWCGYACPQTVWTDLFMAVERWVEGDRGARMRLDAQPMKAAKFAKRAAKHLLWMLIAFLTGGAWIMYFVDAPTLVPAFFSGEASPEAYLFTGLFTATTYLLAGWAREQVCTYMCPWPRFQGAMLDEHSLVVTYRDWRGEPRTLLKQRSNTNAGIGDCIDCNQCVTACPMGIDIRDGQQLACIGCGLCIDACDTVMDKIGRPRHLIAFDTLHRAEAAAKGEKATYTLIRPRTIVYATVLAIVVSIMTVALLHRSRVELHVMRDRAPLYVTLSDGGIRNGYTLKVLNKRRDVRDYALTLDGLPGAALTVQDIGEGAVVPVHVEPDAVTTLRVFVAVPGTVIETDSTPVTFHLREHGGIGSDTPSVFLAPHRKGIQ